MPKIGWVKIAVAACVVISGAIVGAPSALASPAGSTVTTVSSSVNPSVVGQTVMFTATVIGSGATGTPTGTVTFSDDGTPIASAVTLQPDGTATVSISSLQAGDQDVTASYSGDTNFGPSEGGLTQVVQQAASTITVSSSPNPGTAVSTSGWENGVYAITASYAGATLGATICAPAMTTASLAVTSPGQLAIGSGLYTVPGAGTASFGFAVALARRSSSTYVGQLNVVTAGKWWFQGDVTSYGKTGSTHGLLAGTGSLYSWNSTLDRGRGGWQLVKTGVTCTATANAGTKATPSSFGIDIAYSPKSGQPALPNSSPITLTRGGIFIS